MADVYEINVAPHNFYGHLCSAISATFSAIVPNFRVMEIDIEDVPWKDELVTVAPTIENGELVLPTTPGWGADVNEEALKKFEGSSVWTAGADASVALLKVGANAQIDTETAKQPVIGFALTNAGLMANLSLDGTRIAPLNL